MERSVAEVAAGLSRKLDGVFSELDELSYSIADEAQRKAFRRGLGTVILDTYENLFREIFRQYPDLDPDRTTGD